MKNLYLTYVMVATCLAAYLATALACPHEAMAQTPDPSVKVFGRLTAKEDNEPLIGAKVFLKGTPHGAVTDMDGQYLLHNVPAGTYTLVAFMFGLETEDRKITVLEEGSLHMDFELGPKESQLDELVFEGQHENMFGMRYLNAVEGTAIYEAKKTEVIVMKNLVANTATNNARQIYARIPGLNIWEADAGGLQLNIGARGLDPNRTSNFNVRQNGYEISADALGYPESYYTPPTEAIQSIEIIRGAASLQYGTQFGGMLNFVFKEGPKDKPIELVSRQTVGSFGLYNTFNSLGGTIGKFHYYSFYQHKQGKSWRPNAGFNQDMGYAAVEYEPNHKFRIKYEHTLMRYQAQQPGGLTDAMYAQDPGQSVRERNWFRINWNLMALSANYKFSERTKVNFRSWALLAGRDALGNLERINVADFGQNRNLFMDNYRNGGAEARLIHHYRIGNKPSVVLVGARGYKGLTHRRQGDGNNGSGPDFEFLNPDNLENSDYLFPSHNLSFFTENIIMLSPQWSITPGLRFEHIGTFSEGYYKQRVFDFAGNLIVDNTIEESRDNLRSFVFGGVGVSYKPSETVDMYANFSQNFRPVTFNDIRVVNPSSRVDSLISDEFGYNTDLGIRGHLNKIWSFDASLFYLRYNNRIGIRNLAGQPPLFQDIQFRTNIGESQTLGLELYSEVDLWKLFDRESAHSLSWYTNFSAQQAVYIKSEDSSIEGKKVELVPPVMLRTGLGYEFKNFSASYQFSYVHEHYTDATNAERSPFAVIGIVPSYYVMDLSTAYEYKRFRLEGGVNNLSNNIYYTRRAEGYPGPGIIPADARSLYLTFQVKL